MNGEAEFESLDILLVEDNPHDVRLLRDILADTSGSVWNLTVAETLGDALDCLATRSFGAILLDLMLPDSRGLDTLGKINQANPAIAVVVLTGLIDENLGAQALRMGAQDYIIKGQIDGDILSRSVRYAIARSHADIELRRVNRALKVTSECNQVLFRAEEETELLDRVCRVIVEVGGHRMAWVGYPQSDSGKTIYPVAQAGDYEGYLEKAQITWADEERGRGPTGTCIRTGRYSLGKDFRSNPNLAPWRQEAIRRGFISSIALPLIIDGQTIGAITIYSSDPDAFNPPEVNLLSELAEDLAFGIKTLRVRKARQQAEERIRSTNALLGLFAKKTSRKSYLNAVVKLIQKLSRCRCVGIRVVQQTGDIPYDAYTGFSREFWKKENCLNLNRDECMCSRLPQGKANKIEKAFLTPKGSFACDNLSNLARAITKQKVAHSYRGRCIKEGFLTLALIPIRYHQSFSGLIQLADKEPNQLQPDRLEFIEAMVPLIGEAIHRFNVEESLQKSNELLERVFSGIHLQIAYLDRGFNYLRVNEKYALAEGRAPADFIGKYHFELHPDSETLPLFERVVRTGTPYFAYETTLPQRGQSQGKTFYWDWSLLPVKDERGKVAGLVLSLLDVTERRLLEERILEISQREQQRIGQDLHDVLGQNLTGLAFLAKVLETKLQKGRRKEAADAATIAKVSNHAIAQARALARGLCPVDLKAGGLIGAIKEFASNIREIFEIDCSFRADDTIRFQDSAMITHLYYIVQEAVNNALKHGKANRVRIELCRRDEHVVLTVYDNGAGLTTQATHKAGMGLNIMNYRARIIGGTFEIQAEAGGGARVVCTFGQSILKE